jgi:hypothetical protein
MPTNRSVLGTAFILRFASKFCAQRTFSQLDVGRTVSENVQPPFLHTGTGWTSHCNAKKEENNAAL